MERSKKMKLSKRLLLSILLMPYFAINIIALSNLNKTTNLKLLTYSSPPISLGLLMLIGANSGAITISGLFISSNKKKTILKRKVHTNPTSNINDYEVADPLNKYNPTDQDEFTDQFSTEDINEVFSNRDPRDPAPTVSVPYRVINRTSVEIDANEYEYQHNNNDLSANNQEAEPNDLPQRLNDWDEGISDNWQ